MASLLLRVLKIVGIVIYLSFFGSLYTLLYPIGKLKNANLKKKARQLNIQAAKNLKCDASSVFVRLPKNGINLHVVEAGDRNAKLVLLLHGFPDCWHSWSGVIPALVKKGYFVVAPDMRGYNLSDKPSGVSSYNMSVLVSDVKDLLEYYQKDKAFVVAHDWGGVVAWAYADRHPETVEKLIILNAPHQKAYMREIYKNFNQALASWYILFFQLPIIPVNLIQYSPLEAVKLFFVTKKKDALSREDKEVLASAYAQDGAISAMLNYYKALFRARIFGSGRRDPREPRGERKAQLEVPTLILWGNNDVALVPELARCSEWVKDVHVQYIPDCSHWVPYEVPDIVSREVIKFISPRH